MGDIQKSLIRTQLVYTDIPSAANSLDVSWYILKHSCCVENETLSNVARVVREPNGFSVSYSRDMGHSEKMEVLPDDMAKKVAMLDLLPSGESEPSIGQKIAADVYFIQLTNSS